jgi:uncharacterized membrane protein YkoI
MKNTNKSRGWWLPLAAAASLALGACSQWGKVEDLPASTIANLQNSGQVLPFNRLNTYVIAHHPGSQVEHAAIDKDGDHWIYQAEVTDPNKLQWFVELNAKTGDTITDKQDPK